MTVSHAPFERRSESSLPNNAQNLPFTIQTSTTQDSLVCLMRKQSNYFNIWTMRTAFTRDNVTESEWKNDKEERNGRKKEIWENKLWFGICRKERSTRYTLAEHFTWFSGAFQVTYEVSPTDSSTCCWYNSVSLARICQTNTFLKYSVD
jgi:hypothetical protein